MLITISMISESYAEKNFELMKYIWIYRLKFN